MKTKITFFLIVLNLLLLIGFVRDASANNAQVVTVAGEQVIVTDDLPQGAAGADPNGTHLLSFSIVDPNSTDPNLSAPQCRSGNLYSIIKHSGLTTAPGYEYINPSTGGDNNLSFNSGPAGQQNQYNAVFYCANSPVSGTAAQINDQLATLLFNQLGWQSFVWNKTTTPGTNPTQNPNQNNTGNQTTVNGGTTVPAPAPNGIDCTAAANANNPKCLYNPLPTGSLINLVLIVVKYFLGLLGVFAVIFVIIGGFRMVMSQGNEESYTQAKKTITWAILGAIIALMSFSIIAIAQNLLQANVNNTIK